MTLNDIHKDKNLKATERRIFLWLTDNYKKGIEFYITHKNIGEATCVNYINLHGYISNLVEKGYLKKIKHTNLLDKCNSYIILK